MLLLPSKTLPEGEQWLYELKLDGWRGIAVKNGDSVRLHSRHKTDLTKRFPRIVAALKALPATSFVLDGEIVCLDLDGRPCFQDLQRLGHGKDRFLFYYAFDLMHLEGQSLIHLPLWERKQMLAAALRMAPEGLRLSQSFECAPADLIASVKAHKLEGIVAKQKESKYQPGKRSGKWVKFKTYQEAEFLIGGFLPSDDGFSALAVGFMRDGQFHYAAKVEAYLYRTMKSSLLPKLIKNRVNDCPFAHIPQKEAGDSWSAGLTREEIKEFIWLKPTEKAEIRFIEWTRAGYLRQARLGSIL
jgi:bifunctional non-homologous end joining protein LigD